MTQEQRDVKRKLAVLQHAEESGNVALTARRFGISRQCYYKWKHACEERGDEGLINKKPCPVNVTLRTPIEVEEKIGAGDRLGRITNRCQREQGKPSTIPRPSRC